MQRSGVDLLLIAWVVVPLFASPAMAASPETAAKVAEGNAALAAGDFDAALSAYETAEVTCPECPELAYDRGLVHYRMRDFAKAREQFNAALTTRDLGLEARAKYNLGVVSYSEALEKLNAPQEAIELARQAIYHYRDALELQPEDADARANIEIAQLLIKDLLDKLKNEQEQDQQNQDQQDQDQQDQQQQDQQDQQQGDQQQENQQSSEDQEQQQSDENQEQAQDSQSSEDEQQSEDQEQQEQQGQPQSGEQDQQTEQQEAEAKPVEPREMTEEELERALQAVRDREAQRREERARLRNARRAPVTRDW